MENKQSLDILRKLADGVSPYTGKTFGPNSVFQKPDTIRALVAAIHALEQKSNIPANAGHPWDEAEEQQLFKAYKCGKSIKYLAGKHQRTEGAIYARLARLGLIEE